MNAQMVRVICPNLQCRSVLNVSAEQRGNVVRCGRCGFRVRVPMPADAQGAKSAGS